MAGSARSNCWSLAPTTDVLGGTAPNPAFMAGVERAVQRETLKAFGTSLRRVLTPRLSGLLPGVAREKALPKSETMNMHTDFGALPHSSVFPFESRVLSLLEIRKEVSDEIERLLAMLDDLDGDPDLEPNLACWSPDDRDTQPKPRRGGIVLDGLDPDDVICLPHLPVPEGWEIYDEREGDDADREDEGDLEPILGACERHPDLYISDRHFDQSLWSAVGTDDREDEDEREDGADREEDAADAEPSIGATEAFNQKAAWRGGDTSDLEEDRADMEPWLAGYSDGFDDREDQCDDEGDLDYGCGDHDGMLEQMAKGAI